MRILGLDLGSKRVGLAVSDAGEMIASPLEVVSRGGEDIGDARRIARVAEAEDCGLIVVGMPVALSGAHGIAAEAATRFVEILRNQTSLPVVVWDERLSTAQAQRSLIAADVSRDGRKRRVDKVAAALILQNYLDARRASEQGQETDIERNC